MNRLIVSFVFTLTVVVTLFLSTTITGMSIRDHFEWIGLSAKMYYMLCFLIAWFSVYQAMKSDSDYTKMINQNDTKFYVNNDLKK